MGEPPAQPPEPAQPVGNYQTPAEPTSDDLKLTGRVRDAFERMRLQLSQSREELVKMKSQPPPTDKPSTTQVVEQVMQARKDADDLRKQLEKAYDELGRYSLAADPRWQQKYSEPQNAIVEQVKELAKQWELDEKVVDEWVKAKPRDRVDLINQSTPDLMPVVTPLLSQYDHIERLKQLDLAKHKETRAVLDREAQTKHAMLDRAGRLALFKQAAGAVLNEGHFVFKQIEGQDAWNKNVLSLHAQVQQLFEGDDYVAQAKHLIMGVAAPVYLTLYKKERAARLEAEKQLALRMRNKPGLESTERGGGRTPQDTSKGSTAKEVVSDIFRQEGLE